MQSGIGARERVWAGTEAAHVSCKPRQPPPLVNLSHPSLKCQRLLLIQHFFANIKLPVSFFFSLFPCAESLLLCLVRCCQPSLRDRRNARTSRPTACLQDRRWRAVVGGVFHVSGYLSVDAQSACAFDPRSQLRLHRPPA